MVQAFRLVTCVIGIETAFLTATFGFCDGRSKRAFAHSLPPIRRQVVAKKNLRTVTGPQVFATTVVRLTPAATSLLLPDARAHPAPDQKLKLYST
ncbi:MAG: hypothetical protein ACK4E7_00195 [Permianibacter sp.]